MIGLSVVKSASKSWSESPCGCSLARLERHQVHHVDDADLELGGVAAEQVDRGEGLERRHVAAAGHHHVRLAPRSLLAHSQIPMPAVQCLIASSIVSHCGAGCLPATTTLT